MSSTFSTSILASINRVYSSALLSTPNVSSSLDVSTFSRGSFEHKSMKDSVGVENGYDEVNVQIPEEEKRRKILRQIHFRNRFFFTKSFAEETRARKGSLRSDQTRAPLGRYVATEFKPNLSRYVATKRPFCSVAT
ncbi:hypothetical protein DY000_02040064 [Brassica cretica]|uniref:Uncharacterized protein n=1 Tax=Brassica cretica TaxID=69181 RepID=A0ABQ7BIW9_BRACR|nr:hypothetical protein DY000_02040064 [Brassica cretica]